MTNKPVHPAECDGYCDRCPADAKCDHIRLTESKRMSAVVCGCCFIAMLIVLAAVAVKAIAEKMP